MASSSNSKLRGFLVLARASNIPTVWSNCLAGVMLANGPMLPISAWAILLIAASLLYTGGMFLNDAFDVEFDRQFRKERPIPSGLIGAKTVWISGSAMLAIGCLLLAGFGPRTAGLGIVLVALIVAYDALHKRTILSPVLMGACRVLLYLVAASVVGKVSGFAVWHAVVLGLYIVGLSYIAKAESAPGPLRYWPMLFLLSPIVLAWIVNDGDHKRGAILLSILLLVSIGWSIRHLFWAKKKNIGAAVAGLLAGIVFVDLLAVGSLSPSVAGTFIVLFVCARLFQRFIPAT